MRLYRLITVGLGLGTIVACGGSVSLGGAEQGIARHDAGTTVDASPSMDASPPTDAAVADSSIVDGGSKVDASPQNTCAGTCSSVAGPRTVFQSIDELNAISGTWSLCGGHINGPAGNVGIELDMIARKAYFLVAGVNGAPVRGQGATYERRVEVIDTTVMNGPGWYQINLIDDVNGFMNTYFSSYSACPRTLHLDEGTSGNKADYAADAPIVACTIVGTWDLTASDMGATGSFEFDNNGTFYGGAPGANLPEGNTFGGRYNVAGDVFTLESSYGMTCGYSASYKMTFDASCKEVSLHETGDNCTGARKYLHVDQTFRRR